MATNHGQRNPKLSDFNRKLTAADVELIMALAHRGAQLAHIVRALNDKVSRQTVSRVQHMTPRELKETYGFDMSTMEVRPCLCCGTSLLARKDVIS